MKETKQNRYMKIFIIQIALGILAYLLTVVVFSFLMPREAAAEEGVLMGEEDFLKWKAMLCHTLPFVFATAAISFYTMGLKEMFLLCSILATGWMFEWLGRITTFEPETYFLIYCGAAIFLCIYLYPVVNWLCAEKRKLQCVQLILTYGVILGVDIAVFFKNKYIFPYRNPYHITLGIAILLYMLAVTVYGRKRQSEVVEKGEAS